MNSDIVKNRIDKCKDLLHKFINTRQDQINELDKILVLDITPEEKNLQLEDYLAIINLKIKFKGANSESIQNHKIDVAPNDIKQISNKPARTRIKKSSRSNVINLFDNIKNIN